MHTNMHDSVEQYRVEINETDPLLLTMCEWVQIIPFYRFPLVFQDHEL